MIKENTKRAEERRDMRTIPPEGVRTENSRRSFPRRVFGGQEEELPEYLNVTDYNKRSFIVLSETLKN